MIGKYRFAHLLGSTMNNEDIFREAEIAITKMGYICFRPVIYNYEEYIKNKDLLDDMCFNKLLITDICVVVTPNYIGKSTKKRIKDSILFNKPVYVWENGELKLIDDIKPYIQ